MSGHGSGDSTKVVKAALAANFAIAIVKFIAAFLSGSTATLAEAVHSVADTGNQALLLVGMVLATKRNDRLYPFGRAAERYFWPFIVALLLFTLGGAFAVYEGVHKIFEPSAPDLSTFWSLRQGPLLSLLVLGVSMVFEGMSCRVALKEFKASGSSSGRSVGQMLFDVKDPTIPLVLMEDIAALLGLMIAFIAVGVSALTGSGLPDAIGSVVIGIVLMCVAILIARDTHSLLLGERAAPAMERRALELANATPGVRGVTQLLTMHLGPDFIILAMKVAFDPSLPLASIEGTIDDMEGRIRAGVPEMKKIFVEPDSDGDLRGLIAVDGAPPALAAPGPNSPGPNSPSPNSPSPNKPAASPPVDRPDAASTPQQKP